MKILYTLFLLITLSFLHGCTASHNNYYPEDLPKLHTAQIADKMGEMIAIQNPNKQDLYAFKNDPMSNALMTDMAMQGYAVCTYYKSIDELPEGIKAVSHTTDWIDTDRFYVTVMIGEQQKITRLFYLENGSVVPENQILVGTVK